MATAINVSLRLKLFNSCVTPALLYSLETCPLTQATLDKIDTTQRRMLRMIVGWTPFLDENESWKGRGHRMKLKLEKALLTYPIKPSSQLILERKQKLEERLGLNSTSPLLCKVVNWDPSLCQGWNNHVAKRLAGHPRCSWRDY